MLDLGPGKRDQQAPTGGVQPQSASSA